MVKTLERDRYALCEKHVIVPFCCSYQVYRYLADCFGLISCRHYLAKLTNTAAKYAARAGAKAALGGASISLCGAGIPGGVPNVGPMVQDFRVGSYNAWMSSFAFKY